MFVIKFRPHIPCENEKIVFIGVEMSGRLEKPVEAFCKDLKPVRAKNVAFYVINGKGDVSGLEEIKTLEANGVHVAAFYGIAVKAACLKGFRLQALGERGGKLAKTWQPSLKAVTKSETKPCFCADIHGSGTFCPLGRKRSLFQTTPYLSFWTFLKQVIFLQFGSLFPRRRKGCF